MRAVAILAGLTFAVSCGVAFTGDDGKGGAVGGGQGGDAPSEGGDALAGGSGGAMMVGSGGTGGAEGGMGGAPPVCPDGVCSPTESCATCPDDCPGLVDCDGDPDNGCECATSESCCGTACETEHDNGLGSTWLDCEPQGTINFTQAQAAANSWPPSGNVWYGDCGGAGVVCKETPVDCACWQYNGNAAGHVIQGDDCYCPSGGSPTWN